MNCEASLKDACHQKGSQYCLGRSNGKAAGGPVGMYGRQTMTASPIMQPLGWIGSHDWSGMYTDDCKLVARIFD